MIIYLFDYKIIKHYFVVKVWLGATPWLQFTFINQHSGLRRGEGVCSVVSSLARRDRICWLLLPISCPSGTVGKGWNSDGHAFRAFCIFTTLKGLKLITPGKRSDARGKELLKIFAAREPSQQSVILPAAKCKIVNSGNTRLRVEYSLKILNKGYAITNRIGGGTASAERTISQGATQSRTLAI